MRFRCIEKPWGRPMAWTRNTPPPQQAPQAHRQQEQTLSFSHCLTREGKVHGVLLPPAFEHGIASTISRQFSASGPFDLGRSILPWDVGPNLHGKRPGHRRRHWRIHVGANVLDVAQGKGASTNLYGFFSLTLPARPTELRCSFIGYAPLVRTFDGTSDADWNVELSPQSVSVDAVEVVGSAGKTRKAPPWARLKWPWPPFNACPL